ncbi:hypothetical protein EJ03DRAFT_8694 [Teratosphaeria nubilosa]|uniref:Uncharacterized protein n=1 Tax=Teratosphaeria nubilosa TaxID=161662 RepID=A0A6G1LNJ3_9PEZI|nr:hypothetical protein EJ03DRAFT_8694 [Teratosphaeria nubilosa]
MMPVVMSRMALSLFAMGLVVFASTTVSCCFANRMHYLLRDRVVCFVRQQAREHELPLVTDLPFLNRDITPFKPSTATDASLSPPNAAVAILARCETVLIQSSGVRSICCGIYATQTLHRHRGRSKGSMLGNHVSYVSDLACLTRVNAVAIWPSSMLLGYCVA